MQQKAWISKQKGSVELDQLLVDASTLGVLQSVHHFVVSVALSVDHVLHHEDEADVSRLDGRADLLGIGAAPSSVAAR